MSKDMYLLGEMYEGMHQAQHPDMQGQLAPAEDTETPGNSYQEAVTDIHELSRMVKELEIELSDDLGSDQYREVKQQLQYISDAVYDLGSLLDDWNQPEPEDNEYAADVPEVEPMEDEGTLGYM